MYGCESWTIKKAECQRIDTFKLWCWRRFLRVPWTARRSKQSILQKINPDYSLEGLLLKLKLQYFGHLMQRANSSEKPQILGNIQSERRRGWQRMKMAGWHHWHEFEQTLGDSEGWARLECCSPWDRRAGGHDLKTEQQLIQVTASHWVEFPVLYSGFSLAIYFSHSINSVSVSVPVSQFLLPQPQHVTFFRGKVDLW